MESEAKYKRIVNSELIGEYVTIELPGFPSRNRKVEPCKIHYLAMGEGEPLLLCHSVAQSMYTWREIAVRLSESYRVIVFDLPGFGCSGRPLSLNYSVDEMSDCIVMFLDALNIPCTHVMGFSLGAVYMLNAVRRYPERFAKVIALAPGDVTTSMPARARAMQAPLIGPVVREFYNRKYFKEQLPDCFYDSTSCTEELVDQYYASCDDFASRQAIMYALRNYDFDGALEEFPRIEHEVFVLWGAEDRWQPLENMEILRKSLRYGIYYAIRNSGHLMHEEKGAQCADIVQKYLQYEESYA